VGRTLYNKAKRHPAAAISKNQNGRESCEEPDLVPLPDVPLLDEPLPDDVPVGEEPEEPGEFGVREETVVISVIVAVEVDNGLNEVDIVRGDEVRVMPREDVSLVGEEELDEVPVLEELDDDFVDVGLDVELGTDIDEPEVDVG